ncbi:MAG: AAA family ATPase [Bryobacteraceae bacterium]
MGKTFIRSLSPKNVLSFGPDSGKIELTALNVLIGANGSGKSNLLEVVELLRATAGDLARRVREGGGVEEWLWKGPGDVREAKLQAEIEYPAGRMPLVHRVAFAAVGQRLELLDEAIENVQPEQPWQDDVHFYYRFQSGNPAINVRQVEGGSYSSRTIRREDLKPDQSVLYQRRDPETYPELTYLARAYEQIRLYREWNFGRQTAPRLPQQTDLPSDFLLEDATNLALVLNDLEHKSGAHEILIEALREFSPDIENLSVRLSGGTVQLFLREQALRSPIPATRASDGTLRYLSLLAVLCHPSPPALVCIEEPEIGLHPDCLPGLAELLVQASERTQLIVTTHSDVLVDALTERPESVVVCEKEKGQSSFRRLSGEDLREWLDQYRLGEIWRKGVIGGNRY